MHTLDEEVSQLATIITKQRVAEAFRSMMDRNQTVNGRTHDMNHEKIEEFKAKNRCDERFKKFYEYFIKE
jgi:hypothetical protein